METVLVMEAVLKHGEVMRQHLEQQGYKVILSETADNAKALIEKESPNILVMDLNTANETFDQFYHWILGNEKTALIPRLFIAGKMQHDIAQKLEKEYKETILLKPLDIKRFTSTLEKLRASDPSSMLLAKNRAQDYFSSLIGKKIGPAKILKEIGRGGMGAVFLGHQESLDRHVAIKILLPQMVGDRTAIERFQREALAIAKLKSPHIVQVFDFGQYQENAFYIIMEYLPGQTVEQYLRRNGSFPIAKALSVVTQVADGLRTAHETGLIHRDIKPSNLILDNKGHVTITDFGLVRPQRKTKDTQTGIIVGTPHYMPPEGASNTPLDARSDIYSLGIVFYHLMAGHPPYLSSNPMEILIKHMNEPLPDIRKAIPEISRTLVDILQRMTAKDPEQRYINCRELLWELKGQERKYTMNTELLPAPGEAAPHTSKDKISIDASLFPGLPELQKQFPTIFNQDNLQGAMTFTESGNLLNCRGKCPEEWQGTIFILHETTKQMEAAINLGPWQFKLLETPEDVLAIYPQGPYLGTMLFNQKDTGTFSSAALKSASLSLTQTKRAGDPIRQIAAIAGVSDVLLFDSAGQVIDHALNNPKTLPEYQRRIPAVADIIQSISYKIVGMDLWFKSGRALLWVLESGLLLLTASQETSRSFLSIYITAHLELLNTTINTAIIKPPDSVELEKIDVQNPLPGELMDKIQFELAFNIGPIAKVVISKEAKKIGFSKKRFPMDKANTLIENLAHKVSESKREAFKEKVQDLIYEYRSKK